MQHSAGRVNTRCLQRSVGPMAHSACQAAAAAAMTWAVIGRPDQLHRCCIWCRCVACILVASVVATMHPEHPGCIGCITGGPGEQRPADAHCYKERAVPPAHCPPHTPDLATGRSGCTGCIIAPGDTDGRAVPALPSAAPARWRATRPRTRPACHRGCRLAHPPGLDRLRPLHGWAEPYPWSPTMRN